ncbi:MAG: hypothetical protein HY547_04520 [Elusimicrobia bacterium]|nr:hypothetical protein [Elusimicrobiota bacterium]
MKKIFEQIVLIPVILAGFLSSQVNAAEPYPGDETLILSNVATFARSAGNKMQELMTLTALVGPGGLLKADAACEEEIKKRAGENQPMYPINCGYVFQDAAALRERWEQVKAVFEEWHSSSKSAIAALEQRHEQGGYLPETIDSGWWGFAMAVDLPSLTLELQRINIVFWGLYRAAQIPDADEKSLTKSLGSRNGNDRSVANLLESGDFERLRAFLNYFAVDGLEEKLERRRKVEESNASAPRFID